MPRIASTAMSTIRESIRPRDVTLEIDMSEMDPLMNRIPPKLRVRGKTLWAAFCIACISSGCAEKSNDAALREAAWAISTECRACLKDYCATPEGEPAPAAACAADPACSEAFLAFTNCYVVSRSLQRCTQEIDAVKQTGDAGRLLLQNCFLLDCFDAICESTGK